MPADATDNPFGPDPDSRELWWRAAAGPEELLELLDQGEYHRKSRLFVCACARRAEGLMPGPACRRAVDVGEAYADGLATDDERLAAAVAAFAEATPSADAGPTTAAAQAARAAVAPGRPRVGHTAVVAARNAAYALLHTGVPRARIHAALADLLRDIFGNPFRPVAFDPAWRTGTAVSLARHIYDSRDFSPMPILADALQDAGCENPDVLTHCRDAGVAGAENPPGSRPHVRGCWVVDLVLGRA